MKQTLFSSNFKLFKKQSKLDWKNNCKIIKNTIWDPIYFKEEIAYTNTTSVPAEWDICVEIYIQNEKQANKEALDALKLGANSICFINFNNHKLDRILQNIQIDIVKINFRDFQKIEKIISQLTKYQKSNDLSKLRGVFYMNSISEKDFSYFSKLLPNYKFIDVLISSYDDFENHLIPKKYATWRTSKSKIVNYTNYTFEISNQFLLEIARIRSFNIAYQKKYKEVPHIECIINSTAKKYNSLIESTTKCISAILGGCTSIIVKSQEKCKLNIQQQLILKYESFFNKVVDPLHGSYYIEKICNTANPEIKKRKYFTQKWKTLDELILKSQYCQQDIKNINHVDFGAGEPPFLRGPYHSMYYQKKWTIRQYSGFSTAKESNEFYKKNLKAGQTGLSIAFDLPTHRGYDSDHMRVFGDVGKAGVAIDSIDDMEILFHDIDLKQTSVSMTMNGAVIPIMAFFIALAEKRGIEKKYLSGTIQNDILKEFMVRNTYIYPPKESMRIIRDIFKYTSKNMPKFNSISVSGYHMLEAGASADIELAYTLCDGLEYVKNGIKAGLKIDDFAPRLSFFWGIGMNFFTEIAKMRAARLLWAEMMSTFNPKNPKSLMLRSHCQTSGWSLTKQVPRNNITRTTVEALAAVMGGTQSLHTNALDEAISLPTNETAKIARDTQLFLQHETDICNAIDPFGGSYYIEFLTNEIKEKAQKHIKEIEKLGGMVKAIESGLPKLKIEASAIKRQTKIDSNQSLIIGLNCFHQEEKEKENILEIDNKKVQENQILKIQKIKTERDNKKVEKCLKEIKEACLNEEKNLLEIAIEAAKNKATLGEISNACEQVFKRYEAKNNLNSGVFAMEKKHDENFIFAQKLTQDFYKKNGRRPRILTAKLGQDGHDRGMKIIATSFADIGFDVDIAPLFQTPNEIAKQGVENDVHIIGISSLAGGHKTLIPELNKELKKLKKENIIIIVGGIIPEKDYGFLKKNGVSKIFGAGTIVIDAAIDVLKNLLKS